MSNIDAINSEIRSIMLANIRGEMDDADSARAIMLLQQEIINELSERLEAA